MAVAAAVTVASVVRLGLHARREEIEIMELVGAPLAFIRGPFVAEGLLQGGIGALVGAGGLLCGGFSVGHGASWGAELDARRSTAGPAVPAVSRLCAAAGGRAGMLVGGAGGLRGLAACRS